MSSCIMTGGEKLHAKLSELKNQKPKSLEYGFFNDSIYPDGTPIAQVAYWNEYGTVTSPERPFFRFANSIIADKINNVIKDKKLLTTKLLEIIGQRCVINLQKSIRGVGIEYIPNSPSTLEQKIGDTPLIDTGEMYYSAKYKVKEL